jgi:hypothetical protein
MTQLIEFNDIMDITRMAFRTYNSEFVQRKGNIARRKLRNYKNTGEIEGMRRQEIGIPNLDGFGIRSSDSNARVI